MERSRSLDDDNDIVFPVPLPLQFKEYDEDNTQNLLPIPSTSPVLHHRTKSVQPLPKSRIPQIMQRAKSADNLSRTSSSDRSSSPHSSHNTSLEDFKAKAKRKGIVPLPNQNISLEEELKAKQHTILKLQKENEELKEKFASSGDGSYKDDFLSQIETISKLKLDCVLKQNEVDRLKAVEVTLKQTKQVLKDTTWALTVKEEELKNIKCDMRDNYEGRLSELILRLNDRELKLASMKNERDSLFHENRDMLLRVDELTQQVNCYEQELEAKSKQFEASKAEVQTLAAEKIALNVRYNDSSAKMETLVEKLKDMEKKIESSSIVSDNKQLNAGTSENVSQYDGETLSQDKDVTAHKAVDRSNKLADTHSDASTMSEEQITVMIQDNASLRRLVEEGKESLRLSEAAKTELQEEIAEKGVKVNELLEMVNSLRSQTPLNDSVYSTDKSGEPDEDEVLSLPSDDEGTRSLKQQMAHTVSNYEKRIEELQRLYDQDVFTLENENSKLQKEVKDLQSNYLNISNSNNTFVLDYEELKASYNEKIDGLRKHYENLLQKECASSQQQQTELVAENSKLQIIVEEAERKFMEHLQQLKDNFNNNYQTDLTSELCKVFEEQTSTVSAIKEDLRRELHDIKSMHSEGLYSVEQEFGVNESNRSSLDDTYSNEILKLTEERNNAQKAAHFLKDELENVQQEYDSLKELYDALSDDVTQYKDEKVQLLTQISVLSDQSSNLKDSLRDRRNEVDEYKVKISDASRTIEDYTKKLIDRSESSSNPNDSLRSELGELGDFTFGRRSPMASLNKNQLSRQRSTTLIDQVKVLRSNLDEAKTELKNLHDEHGLSTIVFDRLNGILNLLKKYIECEILEQEGELPDKEDVDKSDKSVDNQDSLKLLLHKEIDGLKPIEASSFEISENLSIDDSDLSDATANGDNAYLTQLEFEKELNDLQIDIPFDYSEPSVSQKVNKKQRDELNPSEKFLSEISVLRKQNAILQEKVLWLQNQMDKMLEVPSMEDVAPLEDPNEKTPTGSICDDAFADVQDGEKCDDISKKAETQSLLEDLQNKLHVMQLENDTLKLRLLNQGDTASEHSDASTKTKESFDQIQQLQKDNSILKEKINDLEKDIFGSNMKSSGMRNNNSQPTIEQTTSANSNYQKLLHNMELFNTQDEATSIKFKLLDQECEISIPASSSVKVEYMFDIDNLLEQTIFDEEFDWDISSNSLAEHEDVEESKYDISKQMDSEGHTLKQRDSLSKSFSDLEAENENLRRENLSLKEESERDCATIIGPGFTSEILYYEHAQPIDGDTVGIKVDAIKTLLNNVVVSQGNEAVSFQEYEGRDVILRLLLDIQVEVVDLLKENQVLKVETDKRKTFNVVSSSVQTGESLIVENDDDDDDDAEYHSPVEDEMSLNNLLVLDGSESSLSEQDILCSTILEEQTLGEPVGNQSSLMIQVDDDDIVKQEINDVMVQCPDVNDEELLPKLTSTVKDNEPLGDTGLHIEIVSLEGDDAHITVKVKEKRKKLVLRRFSNILASPGRSDTHHLVDTMCPEIVYLAESNALSSEKKDDKGKDVETEDFKPPEALCESCHSKMENENESAAFTVAGFSSGMLSFKDGVDTNEDTLDAKMSKVKTLLDDVCIFEKNADGSFEKQEQTDIPKHIFNGFQADVSKLQEENDILKMEADKERVNRMRESLQRTKSSSMESLNRSVEVIPGFNSDCLLQEQSINSAVDTDGKDDALSMLIDNLIIFEGTEEIGFKTTDGNDLSRSFITDCRCQLVDLKKENADLKLQVQERNQGDFTNVTDTSLQQCLISESPAMGDSEITTVTHYIDDSLTDVGQSFAFSGVRKVSDSNEKVQKQQSFLIPGFSSELFPNETASEISSDSMGLSNLPLLLDNVAVFEGNEEDGFTKSEENDITIKLINAFKTEVVGLMSENKDLKGKIKEMESIHGPMVSSEGINQELLYAGVEIDEDDALNREYEMDLFVPGFSSEILLSEDVLPFCEVDGLTRKFDALKQFLKKIVIFKGNDRIGFTKCNDADISMQLLTDLEFEVTQLMKENASFKQRPEIQSVRDSSTEKEAISLLPCFSSEIDENSLSQFAVADFANLPKENEGDVSIETSMVTQFHKRPQYLKATKNQLIDLLEKKDAELEQLVVKKGQEDLESVQYEESIQKAKEWMECVNLESLTQLRADLDEDYIERIKVIEEKLQEVYRLRMKKARHTCDEKIVKMKKDYEEEIAKLQSKDFLEESDLSLESYMESLDESIATLIDDSKDDTHDDTVTDNTKDEGKNMDSNVQEADDDSYSSDDLRRSRQGKDLSDKCVNTTSSYETHSEASGMEQKEIDKLKESIIELFKKPEVGSGGDATVLFRLDDVEGILQENYEQITDMTDKLKGKLCALEKDMMENFNNTLQEKEVEFEEEKIKLIFKTKNDLLHDVSSILTKLINKHVIFVDNRMSEILPQLEGDLKVISQSLELHRQKKDSLMSDQEKVDMPEKLLEKMEDIFQTEDILGILSEDTYDQKIEECDNVDCSSSFDYDEDGLLFKLEAPFIPDTSSMWCGFFKDEDCLPQECKTELTNKKIEFKCSIEKNLNTWASHINRALSNVSEQVIQFNELKSKHKSLRTTEEMGDKAITSLANAHTEMVLKTSLHQVEGNASEVKISNKAIASLANAHTEMILNTSLHQLKGNASEMEISKKIGKFLLNRMDPVHVSQVQSQYDNILQKYDSIDVDDEIEKSMKDQFQKEIDDVTKSCVQDAVQALLENEESSLFPIDQGYDAKKVRFYGGMPSIDVENEITRLNTQHAKELNELQNQLDSTVAKMVKQATDEKVNEFDGAKMDLVKQHHFVLDEFVREQERQIDEIIKDHKTNEEEMRVQFQKQLEELRKEHEDQLSGQKDTICAQFEKEHTENLGKLQKQIEEDHANHLKVLHDSQQNQLHEIQDLTTQHEKQVQMLQLKHAEEIDKLKRDISNLEDNISQISAGILGELEVLEELRIPTEDEHVLSSSSTDIIHGGISGSITNCYKETQKNVKAQYNSQLDVLLNLFDSVMEKVSSKVSLPSDSFSSELLLTEKTSSRRSIQSFTTAEDGTLRPTIINQIDNTFKQLQDEYETWYARFSSEIETQRKQINQLEVRCESAADDKELQTVELNRLKLSCENAVNDQEVIKEQALEIEALKCSISNQQVSIETLKEQLIKKQMVLDAKECQLIEMEEQSKKESQKFMLKLEEASDSQQLTQKSLEEKLIEVKELNDFLESKLAVIAELEQQLNRQQLLVDSKEQQLADVKEEMCKQKEKYDSEYKQVMSDKGSEVSAMYNELEGTLKEKDSLEKVVKTQEEAMLKLQEELNKFNDLSSAKDIKVTENEQMLRKEINRLESMMSTNKSEQLTIQNALDESMVEKNMLQDEVSKHQDRLQAVEDKHHDTCEKLHEQINGCNRLIEEQRSQLEKVEDQLKNEREKFARELSETVCCKDEEIASLQSAFDESVLEKDCLEGDVSKHQVQLEDIISGKEKLIEELHEKLTKQKDTHMSDLKELSDTKGKEISAIFNELEGKLKENDRLEDLVEAQKLSISKLEDDLSKQSSLNSTKEEVMNEMEESLKKDTEKIELELESTKSLWKDALAEKENLDKLVGKQQGDLAKKKEELRECQEIIENNKIQYTQLKDNMMVEKGKHVLEVDKLISTKNEELSNLHVAIKEISKEKDELEDMVNLKQTYINELERQLKDSKDMLQRQEDLLADVEQQLVSERGEYSSNLKKITDVKEEECEENQKEKNNFEDVIKKQLSNIRELGKERNDCKAKIDEKQAQLNELQLALDEERRKYTLDIEQLRKEKSQEVLALQRELKKSTSERNQLMDGSKTNDEMLDNLQEEFNEMEKLIVQEKEEHQLTLQNLSQEKNEQITMLQNELEKESETNYKLECLNKEHVETIENLEERIREVANKLDNSSWEKNDEIIALQLEVEKTIMEKDKLRIRNEELVSKLKEQLSGSEKQCVTETLLQEKSQEITALQNELNKKLKEIAELKNEKNEHAAIIGQLRKDFVEMEKQLVEQREKHRSDIDHLIIKKDAESAVNETILAESSKEKSLLAEQVCNLEHQLNESKNLLDVKQEQLSDAQDRLIEELEKSAMSLKDMSMDKSDEISTLQCEVVKLNKEIQCMEIQLAKEKESHKVELQALQSLQPVAGGSSIEKSQMENVLSKQQAYIGELEDRLKKSKQFMDEKHAQLDHIEEQLKYEKARHAADLEKISKEIEASHLNLEMEKARYVSELAKVLATQEDICKGHEQDIEQKVKEIDELRSLIDTQKSFTDELENVVETKNKGLEASEQKTAELVLELKKEVNELNAKINKQEKNLKERGQLEADLKEAVGKQKSFISELETKLQAHQLLLDDKKREFSDLKQQLSEERKQHTLDYEQSSAKQKETMLSMEKVLEGEVQEKEELKNYVKSMEDLTEQLKTQLNKLTQEVNAKENQVTEMKKALEKSLQKQNADLERITSEKADVTGDLESQLNAYKVKAMQLEEQVNRTKEEYAKEVESHLAVNNKHLEQLNENKATIAQKEKYLIEMNAQHADALQKLQFDFESATKEREEQISVLEKSIAMQMKEADELKDIVKRQQALVHELDQQLNQQKTQNSLSEKEAGEINETIRQTANAEILELQKELSEVKEKLISMGKTLKESEETITKHQIHITQLEEQINEQSVLLQAKDHEFIETKEAMLKEHGQYIQKLEGEKNILTDNVNKMEEKLLDLEYNVKTKTEELGELQKSQQQMQLEHINEIMKLNTEHRQQIGSLMEIPQKNRNIKSLLLDLQKEADEVLDLVVNVPDINVNSSLEQIESLKATWLQEKEMLLGIIDDMRKNPKDCLSTQMSAVSTANMSTEEMEDFPHDHFGEVSTASMLSIASDLHQQRRMRPQGGTETISDITPVTSQQHTLDASVHDNQAKPDYEKRLNEESKKVADLATKLEDAQMSHESELKKVLDRESNLKDKYLKVAEFLQKEKNEKARVMEMLNDAQRLNEIQAQNLEEVQNDKNSLLESYALVSELENLLTKEREKVNLVNAKLEKERYEKASLQASLIDEKSELKATKEREISLKEKCRELSKLFENETELRKNIADALDSEKKMIVMEKRNLEQKEVALNQKVAELGNDSLTDKFKSLKAWEAEMKKREKSVVAKEEKVKSLISRIEQGYDILPQKQVKDSSSENNIDSCYSDENDWLRQIQSDQLLDTKHLPLVADLNQKIKNLQKEKVKLLDNLSDLRDEITDYKKQLKHMQNQKDQKSQVTDDEVNEQTSENKDETNADGQKLLNAGWTIAKVQRLYLKYFRAESFRKALVYQKRYLSLMLNENESQVGSVNNWLNSGVKRKYTFKVVVLAVISIRRMKYLVKKYHRNLHKSSPQYQYKDKARNNKKKGVENAIDEGEHSPIRANESRNNALKPHHPNKGNSPKSPSKSPKGNSRVSQSKYASQSSPLPDEQSTNTRVSKHVSVPASDRLGQNDVLNNHVHGTDVGNGTHFGGSYIENIDECQNVPASSLDMWATGVPRSYPRPSGIHPDEYISKISRTNGDSTSTHARLDKSPYSSNPFTSHPTPLLSSTSRDVEESTNETNESLSTYIQTLETLQNRLKKVGYNDRSRPSLL